MLSKLGAGLRSRERLAVLAVPRRRDVRRDVSHPSWATRVFFPENYRRRRMQLLVASFTTVAQ